MSNQSQSIEFQGELGGALERAASMGRIKELWAGSQRRMALGTHGLRFPGAPEARSEPARYLKQKWQLRETKPWETWTHVRGSTTPNPYQESTEMGKIGPKLFSDQSKLVRLSALNEGLNSIIQFDQDDQDDDKRKGSLLGTIAKVGATAGVGTAGLYGYGLTRRGVDPGKFGGGLYRAAGTDIRNIGSAMGAGRLPTAAVSDIGSSIAAGGRGVWQGAKAGASKLGGLWGKLRGLFHASAKTPDMIHFDEKILQPFAEGAAPDSKILQEQFPAGLSPAAALRLPFPELMRLLKQRNILQEQFTGFSRIEKLTELDSNIDQLIQFADLTGKANWKGQTPQTNVRRGIGAGALTFPVTGPLGAIGGGIAGGSYGKRGVIYKKRDPIGHSVEGVIGSAALGTAGQALGGALGGERGALIGKGIGSIGGFAGGFGLGARHTLKKRQWELKHGQNFSTKMQRLIRLDSGLDDLIELEFTEEAKKKFEDAKEKIKAKYQKKKGHRSHGGGT